MNIPSFNKWGAAATWKKKKSCSEEQEKKEMPLKQAPLSATCEKNTEKSYHVRRLGVLGRYDENHSTFLSEERKLRTTASYMHRAPKAPKYVECIESSQTSIQKPHSTKGTRTNYATNECEYTNVDELIGGTTTKPGKSSMHTLGSLGLVSGIVSFKTETRVSVNQSTCVSECQHAENEVLSDQANESGGNAVALVEESLESGVDSMGSVRTPVSAEEQVTRMKHEFVKSNAVATEELHGVRKLERLSRTASACNFPISSGYLQGSGDTRKPRVFNYDHNLENGHAKLFRPYSSSFTVDPNETVARDLLATKDLAFHQSLSSFGDYMPRSTYFRKRLEEEMQRDSLSPSKISPRKISYDSPTRKVSYELAVRDRISQTSMPSTSENLDRKSLSRSLVNLSADAHLNYPISARSYRIEGGITEHAQSSSTASGLVRVSEKWIEPRKVFYTSILKEVACDMSEVLQKPEEVRDSEPTACSEEKQGTFSRFRSSFMRRSRDEPLEKIATKDDPRSVKEEHKGRFGLFRRSSQKGSHPPSTGELGINKHEETVSPIDRLSPNSPPPVAAPRLPVLNERSPTPLSPVLIPSPASKISQGAETAHSESVLPPTASCDHSTPATPPAVPVVRERKSSGFFRLFSKKVSDSAKPDPEIAEKGVWGPKPAADYTASLSSDASAHVRAPITRLSSSSCVVLDNSRKPPDQQAGKNMNAVESKTTIVCNPTNNVTDLPDSSAPSNKRVSGMIISVRSKRADSEPKTYFASTSISATSRSHSTSISDENSSGASVVHDVVPPQMSSSLSESHRKHSSGASEALPIAGAAMSDSLELPDSPDAKSAASEPSSSEQLDPVQAVERRKKRRDRRHVALDSNEIMIAKTVTEDVLNASDESLGGASTCADVRPSGHVAISSRSIEDGEISGVAESYLQSTPDLGLRAEDDEADKNSQDSSDNADEARSTRRIGGLKDRIRNRKLQRKEASERHRSLPAGFAELDNVDFMKKLPKEDSLNNDPVLTSSRSDDVQGLDGKKVSGEAAKCITGSSVQNGSGSNIADSVAENASETGLRTEAEDADKNSQDSSDNTDEARSTRRIGGLKDRIRNRKLQRKEASDRHRSLPAGFADFDNVDFTKDPLKEDSLNADPVWTRKPPDDVREPESEKGSSEAAKNKKKSKRPARRANTEFIVLAPGGDSEEPDQALSVDDDVVMRRNNKRNLRRDRSKTITSGIDADAIFAQSSPKGGSEKSGVVTDETMSFSDIKKRLLAGFTADQKKVEEKQNEKNQKKSALQRRKSNKRYKTITEGIAPQDLALIKAAMDLERPRKESTGTIDAETLAQITSMLTSTTNNRKSFVVDSRPSSRYNSTEDLSKIGSVSKDDSVVVPELPKKALLQRTKSMTTIHLLDKTEMEQGEPEIQPLSVVKNRFLQAMEETKQKHLSNKTAPPVIRRQQGKSRKERPHTISGLDDITFERVQEEVKAHGPLAREVPPKASDAGSDLPPNRNSKASEEPPNRSSIASDTPSKRIPPAAEEQPLKAAADEAPKRNTLASEKYHAELIKGSRDRLRPVNSNGQAEDVAGEDEQPKREKKKVTRADSKKLFDELYDDLEELMSEGLDVHELGGALEVNPSLHQDNFKYRTALSSKNVEMRNENVRTSEPGCDSGPDKRKQVLDSQAGSPEAQAVPAMSDIDYVSSLSTQLPSLASGKRHLRPQRNHQLSANPVKALQGRNDLIEETETAARAAVYQDEVSNIDFPGESGVDNPGAQSLIRSKSLIEKLNNEHLAKEAIAGLRSVEDFSKAKVTLRKVNTGEKVVEPDSFAVSKVEKTLLHIKGRKKVQTSVVGFTLDSVNSSDSFVMVTPTDLVCFHGSNANVIEKAKAVEIAQRIYQKKEMGCKALEVQYVDQGTSLEGKFLKNLNGSAGKTPSIGESNVSDEDFEKMVTSAYMTYMVCEAGDKPELIPLDAMCHRMPSKEILLTDSAFVFDFISEVYVWCGKQTVSKQRKIIQDLAKEKFEEGYFKLSLESPAHFQLDRHLGKSRKISVASEATHFQRRGSVRQSRRASVQQGRYQKREMVPRPPYALLLDMFEGAEWVIFKEKFSDWPDDSRIIKVKGPPILSDSKSACADVEIEPVDPKTMVNKEKHLPMVLDGTDIGRGKGVPKGMDGYHVVTQNISTWHVSENNAFLLPDESFGQFHSGEGYVVRWEYRIVKVRALRNVTDVSEAGGRDQCCYFFWLGNDCSVTEQGATAVMTIELDKEKGPQIRCVLGKEPPCFLNLFDGAMVIHAGKRPVPGLRNRYTDKTLMRLYCIRGEEESEACLLQVPACCESLRSRSSFLLLLCSQGEIFLWHGCFSNEGTRKAAQHAAKQLIHTHPEEAGIADKDELGLTEVEEGDEPDVFWIALGGHEDYGSLLESKRDWSKVSPRLFQLSSTTGQFIAHEILCPSETESYNCPFPVLQDDMYNVDQPAIFLFDTVTHVYLWFGWWPDDEDLEINNSMRRRWDKDRRKAMESAMLYANEMGRPLDKVYAVYAGLEPESFIEMFPYWVYQEDITDLQIDEGIEEDKLYKIGEELEMYLKEFYSFEELQRKPPPPGVDPTKLEKYLSEEEFYNVFHFPKDTFFRLPEWQQVNWKKKVGLY